MRKLKANYEWCFSRLQRNKIGPAQTITSWTAKNSRNNVFRKKQTTNKILPNVFRRCEVRTKVRLMFWRSKKSMKCECYVFSGYKQRNKVCLVYLENDLRQNRYSWCVFKLKCRKNGGNHIFKDKQTRDKVPLMLLHVKVLAET